LRRRILGRHGRQRSLQFFFVQDACLDQRLQAAGHLNRCTSFSSPRFGRHLPGCRLNHLLHPHVTQPLGSLVCCPPFLEPDIFPGRLVFQPHPSGNRSGQHFGGNGKGHARRILQFGQEHLLRGQGGLAAHHLLRDQILWIESPRHLEPLFTGALMAAAQPDLAQNQIGFQAVGEAVQEFDARLDRLEPAAFVPQCFDQGYLDVREMRFLAQHPPEFGNGPLVKLVAGIEPAQRAAGQLEARPFLAIPLGIKMPKLLPDLGVARHQFKGPLELPNGLR